MITQVAALSARHRNPFADGLAIAADQRRRAGLEAAPEEVVPGVVVDRVQHAGAQHRGRGQRYRAGRVVEDRGAAEYCYLGPVFCQRADSFDEFLQIEFELIGRPGVPLADADLLGLALDDFVLDRPESASVRFHNLAFLSAVFDGLNLCASSCIYGTFSLDDLAVTEHTGTLVSIARIEGSDFSARLITDGFAKTLGTLEFEEQSCGAELSWHNAAALAGLFQPFSFRVLEIAGLDAKTADGNVRLSSLEER